MGKDNQSKQKAGEAKKASRRHASPIFEKSVAKRVLGVSDALVIDLERLLRLKSKRPQKVTELFEERLFKDLTAQFEKLDTLSVSDKVLRWEGSNRFVDYSDISIKILKTVLDAPDWSVRIPVADANVLEKLISAKDELIADRVHLGFSFHLSSSEDWGPRLPNLSEKAHENGFNVYAILEYSQPDPKHVRTALELAKGLRWLDELQVDISPNTNWSNDLEGYDGKKLAIPAQEAIARNIFRAFRAGFGDIRLSFKYHPAAGCRAWWTAQFGDAGIDPVAVFSECFGKSVDDWSEEDRRMLLELSGEVRNSLKASIDRAYSLHKIRLLGPNKEEKDDKGEDPSFANACKAMWRIEKTQVYRLIRAGKFLYLLENKGVPKEEWPTRETHIRNLVDSGLAPEEKVECWKNITRQYADGRLTARHINQDVDAVLIEKGLDPVGNKKSTGFSERLRSNLDSIIQRVNRELSEEKEAQSFVEACRVFSKYLQKEGLTPENGPAEKVTQPKRKAKPINKEEISKVAEPNASKEKEQNHSGQEQSVKKEASAASVAPDATTEANEHLEDNADSLFE